MKKSVLVYLLFVCYIVATAQTTVVDSLTKILDQHETKDTVRVNLLNDLGFKIFTSDIDKTMIYAKEALQLSNEIPYPRGKAKALNLMGIYHYTKGEFYRAQDKFLESLVIKEEIGDNKGIASSLNNIGVINENKGDYPLALEYYQRALKIYEDLNDLKGISTEYNNIGTIYGDLENFAKALEYYQKSFEIDSLLSNNYGKGIDLNNIGKVHFYMKNFEKSIFYHQKALKIFDEISFRDGISMSLMNIGSVKEAKGEHNEALDYYLRSLKIYEEIGRHSDLCVLYIQISDIYRKKGNFTKALDFANKSLNTSGKLKLLEDKATTLELLSNIYVNKRDYKKAYEYYIDYKQLNDSIFNEENVRKITGLEYQYEFEKEKKAIEEEQKRKDLIYEQERHQGTVQRNSFIAAFLIALILASLIYTSLHRKKKSNKLLTQLNKEISSQKELIEQQNEKLKTNNEKLVELDEFKQGMTGMIVHDLKNPLNAILNPSKSLAVEGQLQTAKQYGGQMLNMVLNILDLQKYQDTKMVLDLRETKIFDIVKQAIGEIQFLSEAKNIQLNNKMPIGYRVMADPDILRRVLVNLLTNAIKFTPNNGEVTIGAEEVSKSNYLKIYVVDTGEGVSGDEIDRVFDKFAQVQVKESGTIKSTGLGLTFCKIAIEAHGGEIGVSSELGKGTLFWFLLHTTSHVENDTAVIEPTEHEIKLPVLTQSEVNSFSSSLSLLKETKLYHISQLKKILSNIDEGQSENVKKWKEAIEKAIRTEDLKSYQILIDNQLD